MSLENFSWNWNSKWLLVSLVVLWQIYEIFSPPEHKMCRYCWLMPYIFHPSNPLWSPKNRSPEIFCPSFDFFSILAWHRQSIDILLDLGQEYFTQDSILVTPCDKKLMSFQSRRKFNQQLSKKIRIIGWLKFGAFFDIKFWIKIPLSLTFSNGNSCNFVCGLVVEVYATYYVDFDLAHFLHTSSHFMLIKEIYL